ncbi:MAG TPA: GxxExxY protein [Anaerolineales bacterium]|nr:GxxExxY protein [Anaerolineales bacterium]
MTEKEYKHSDLTGKIIGAAMKVHSALGNGFQEVIYQRALDIEMKDQGLNASREHEMDIFYKGIKIGHRRVDFFVEEKVMVEIKAVSALDDAHLAQAINYLEAYNLEIGLLLNFGAKSLQYRRVINSKHLRNQSAKSGNQQ